MTKLIFPSSEETQKASRLTLSGEWHRIRNGIYIDTNDPNEIIRTLNNNWMEVAGNIIDDPVAVARTAVELEPAEGRLYFVSNKLTSPRVIKVGHLEFSVSHGNIDRGVQQVSLNMKRSNPARYCLENLVLSRGDKNSRKTLGGRWVESELVSVIRRGGEQAINDLRDEARSLSVELGLEEEFNKLNALIASLLKTHPAEGVLQTRPGLAEAKGEPFDQIRLEKFEALSEYLKSTKLSPNDYEYNKSGWRNLTFFESYFSNYIEGTEFTLEEAEEIAFEKKEVYGRHQDSHDVMAHIDISGDMTEMHKVPADKVELIDVLKVRHEILLSERPDKRPGQFKVKPNKAGATDFVLPELVEGTLVQGFDFYQSLPVGMLRAVFIHFMISEVHPFDDGNGRLARIMLNAELVSQDQYKLIIPIVHRDSYLHGLRTSTRRGSFRAMVKVLHQMQCYTASLDWSEYGEVKTAIQKHAADKEPDEGISVFNKVIAKLGGQYPAG